MSILRKTLRGLYLNKEEANHIKKSDKGIQYNADSAIKAAGCKYGIGGGDQ